MNEAFETREVTQDGRTFRIELFYDYGYGPPWEEHDGHGIIRKSRTPHRYCEGSKQPGELALNDPSRFETQYFYDFAGTIAKARAEGWGLGNKAMADLTAKLGRAPTAREVVAESVRLDFEYLSGWINNKWFWCGVAVTDITCDYDAKTDFEHACWGFSSDDKEAQEEFAHEEIDNMIQDARIGSRFADAMACAL